MVETPPRADALANGATNSYDLIGRPRPPLPPHSTDLMARRRDNAPANRDNTADLTDDRSEGGGDGPVAVSSDAADSMDGNDDTPKRLSIPTLGPRHATLFTKEDTEALVEAVRVYVKAQYAIFSEYDHDKNLRLDKEEYRKLRKAHHTRKKNSGEVDDDALTKRIDQEFNRIDANGDKTISFKEFVEHLHLEKWKAILNFPRKGSPPQRKYEQFVRKYEQLRQSAHRDDPKGYRDVYKGLPVFARYPVVETGESDFVAKNKSATELWEEYEKEKKDHKPKVPESVSKKKSLLARVQSYADGSAAGKEEAWAQAVLGEMYEIGFGTQDNSGRKNRENPAEAKKWYQKAAKKEVAWAMEKLWVPGPTQDENAVLEVEEELNKNRKDFGDAVRQRALGVMYPATIKNILSEDTYEIEYEDKEITRTEAVAREDLEPRVATEKLRFIATGFDDWWNSLSILGLASEQSAAKPVTMGGPGAAEYFDYHTLDFRIIGAAHRAEVAEHKVELARQQGDTDTEGTHRQAVEKENGSAADAAFWRYALETRRVEKFYRRAFVCSTPELCKGDDVEYRTEKNSRWVKGTLQSVPKDDSSRVGSSSYFGRSSKSSFFARSSRRWRSSAPSGRAAPTTSRAKFTVKHRYLSRGTGKGEEVPRKYIRRDLGFIANKIPTGHTVVDREQGALQYALHWLRGVICCAHVGQPRVVTVQTGIGGEGQDQQKAILLYRPDADPSKYQKVAKRIPVSRVTSIRLGNSNPSRYRTLEQKKGLVKQTGMPNTPVFETFHSLNHHIPPEYCFSILTDAAEKGNNESPSTISISMRGESYDENPVTGTYRMDGRKYVRIHSTEEDCNIVRGDTSRGCFSPTFEWYIKVDNTDMYRTKSTGRSTLIGSTWETRQSSFWEKCLKSCCPRGKEPACKPHWEVNDDLVVRKGELVVPHVLLLSSTSKETRKQEAPSKWFLEFKNEQKNEQKENAATRWGGSYLNDTMKEDEHFSWTDLPVAGDDDDDDDAKVNWKQIQSTAVDAGMADLFDAGDDGGLDWRGIYVIDPRDRYLGTFRYGYPRYVRIERDWKGNICPHMSDGRELVDRLSNPRYYLQRERNGQWFLRSSKTLLHVRRMVKDGQPDGGPNVTVQPIFAGKQQKGQPVELAIGGGAFLNGAAEEGEVLQLKVEMPGFSKLYDLDSLKPALTRSELPDIEGKGWRGFIEDPNDSIKLQVSVSRVILYSRARHEPSEHGSAGASNPFFNSHRSGMFWTYHSLFENVKCNDLACSGHHAHDFVMRPLPQKVEIEQNSDPDVPRKTYELVHDIFTSDATCFVQDGLPLYRSRYDKGPDGLAEKLVCSIKPALRESAEREMHRCFTTKVSVVNDVSSESMPPTEWRKQKNSLRETLDIYIRPCGVCDFCIRQKQYCGSRGEAWREMESKGTFCQHAKSERDDLAAALSRFILDSKSTKGEGIEGLGTAHSASGSDDASRYSEFGRSNRSALGNSSRFGRSNSSARGARSSSQQRMDSGNIAAPVEERKEAGPGPDGAQLWYRHEDQDGDTFDA